MVWGRHIAAAPPCNYVIAPYVKLPSRTISRTAQLWYLAEEDLLREGNSYRLTDTGQGLNRVQQAPAVSREVHRILARCQARTHVHSTRVWRR